MAPNPKTKTHNTAKTGRGLPGMCRKFRLSMIFARLDASKSRQGSNILANQAMAADWSPG
jgi:hypothetical protein